MKLNKTQLFWCLLIGPHKNEFNYVLSISSLLPRGGASTELSNELVDLLMSRDQLKTENESKVVDIDDIKAILAAVGPETAL